MSNEPRDEEYSPDEAALRRDEVVKRMLATPPQPKPKKPAGSNRGRPPKTSSAT
jgi:hypothetical protein